MPNTWTVVKFLTEDTVEAVPTTWILGSQFYWPPFTDEKIRQAIGRNDKPNTCWPLYNIETFRNGTFDDYLVARKKSRKAEYNSDLTSEDDLKMRKVNKRKYVTSSDEDDIDVLSIPNPPRIPEKHQKRQHTTEDPNRYDLEEPRIATTPLGKNKFSLTQMTSDVNSNVADTLQNNGVENIALDGSKSFDKGSAGCTCCALHKNGDNLKNVLRQQIIIRSILTEIRENLEDFKDRSIDLPKASSAADSIFNILQFPIGTDETLQQLEVFLKVAENFKNTVLELSKFGGRNLYDFTKRCLGAILTNEFASGFSWYGAKKKKIFSTLKLADVLIEASQKNNLAKDRKAIEDSVESWLRRAKERDALEKKKTNVVNV